MLMVVLACVICMYLYCSRILNGVWRTSPCWFSRSRSPAALIRSGPPSTPPRGCNNTTTIAEIATHALRRVLAHSPVPWRKVLPRRPPPRGDEERAAAASTRSSCWATSVPKTSTWRHGLISQLWVRASDVRPGSVTRSVNTNETLLFNSITLLWQKEDEVWSVDLCTWWRSPSSSVETSVLLQKYADICTVTDWNISTW